MAEVDSPVDRDSVSREVIDAGPTRVPDPDAAERIYQPTDRARKDGDSFGGMVECVCCGVPPGPGEPLAAGRQEF